jgi:hypothetical protein
VGEPIEHGSEEHEGKKRGSEFIVAGADPAVFLDAGEEVFDVMTAAIVTSMKAGGLVPATSGRNAALGVLVAQARTERVGVKALVGHQPMLPHGG